MQNKYTVKPGFNLPKVLLLKSTKKLALPAEKYIIKIMHTGDTDVCGL